MNRKQIFINLLILLVFLIGLAFLPFTALGNYEELNWELFAEAYTINYFPEVTSNYYTGDRGSEFEITGRDFPPNYTIYLGVNVEDQFDWRAIIRTDNEGSFFLVIDTSNLNSTGYGFYKVEFSTGQFFDWIPLFIMTSAPVRTTDDTTSLRIYIWGPEPIYDVFVPMITR
jgi:hypothetical protein